VEKFTGDEEFEIKKDLIGINLDLQEMLYEIRNTNSD